MNIFYCKMCGKKIPIRNRSNSVYCSVFCRKDKYELTTRKQRLEASETQK